MNLNYPALSQSNIWNLELFDNIQYTIRLQQSTWNLEFEI